MSLRIAKYEVLEKIAEGGFGTVYKARDPFIKRLVAIKTCSVADEEMARRFYREAEIAGRFDHPNVTIVHDFGVEDQVAYLVQEYLTGEDLLQKIRRRDPLPLRQKVEYLLQVASGLAYAHAQQVIHRDIKPANLRVVESGQVKILDFGIAKLATATTQLTQKGVAVGTVGYLSPEQLRGQELDTRTDIFSYGVVAYELLTYARPFHGRQLSALMDEILHRQPLPVVQHVPDCPPPLDRVVLRCLEKDRELRYQSFHEVIADLEEVRRELSGRQPVAAPFAGAPSGVVPLAAEPAAGREDGPATRPIPLPTLPPPPSSAVPATAGMAAPTAPAGAAGPSPAGPPMPTSAPAPGAPLPPPPMVAPTVVLAVPPALPPPPSPLAPTVVMPAGAGVPPPPPTAPPIAAVGPPAVAVVPAEGPPSAARPAATPAARPAARPALPAPGTKRRLLLAAGGAAALLAVAALGVGLLIARGRSERTTPPVAAPQPRPSAAPAVAATTGRVVVLGTPWGELDSLRSADGRELALPSRRETPLVLSLPAGRYVATLHHPAAPAPVSCEVDVVLGGEATCRALLVPLEPMQYFKEAGWWR